MPEETDILGLSCASVVDSNKACTLNPPVYFEPGLNFFLSSERVRQIKNRHGGVAPATPTNLYYSLYEEVITVILEEG